MIVVRAMPVVKAKARSKTTKIIFMTLALCRHHKDARTGQLFCDGRHGTPVFTAHRRAGRALKRSFLSSCVSLSLCREGGPPIAALPWPAGRRAIAASSHARSCSHDKPARWLSPTAAVLAASACRPIDLAPDRFLRRRASPSAGSRRPRVERPRSRQATTAWSTHRRPHKPLGHHSTAQPPQRRASAVDLIRRSQRFWSKVAARQR